MPKLTEQEKINAQHDGDHDKFAHYVDKDDMMEAFVYGVPIIALCGKIWVPEKTGDGYQTCPECEKIYSELQDRFLPEV